MDNEITGQSSKTDMPIREIGVLAGKRKSHLGTKSFTVGQSKTSSTVPGPTKRPRHVAEGECHNCNTTSVSCITHRPLATADPFRHPCGVAVMRYCFVTLVDYT